MLLPCQWVPNAKSNWSIECECHVEAEQLSECVIGSLSRYTQVSFPEKLPSLSSGFSSSLDASISSSSWADTVEATLSHCDTSRSSRGLREDWQRHSIYIVLKMCKYYFLLHAFSFISLRLTRKTHLRLAQGHILSTSGHRLLLLIKNKFGNKLSQDTSGGQQNYCSKHRLITSEREDQANTAV